MSARAYYNEHDPYAAQWLRNLIAAGEIAPGDVDERDVRDVTPGDVVDYTQVHLFAGVGVWSRALREAGWPDDRPVWTGSCPCQPFSAAGRGGGFADKRHLWPAMHHLADQCRPPCVLGEQVASRDGLGWLDLVCADMEGSDYAFGAADLGAACVGAPHIRQRLWWVADARYSEFATRRSYAHADARETFNRAHDASRNVAASRSRFVSLANSIGPRLEGRHARPLGHECEASERGGAAGELEHASCDGRQQRGTQPDGWRAVGAWDDADWLLCRDEKWRPVEPGTFPLAHGAPARVGRLRAYGNAVVLPLARHWVEVVMSATDNVRAAA